MGKRGGSLRAGGAVAVVTDALLWAFEHLYHQDKANAALHCAPVKFSPLTFRLAEALEGDWSPLEDFTRELDEVLHHRGSYPEDRGR
jgi:hypothetical protein